MKVLKQEDNWVIVTHDNLEGFDAWWESEAWIKTENGWECRCCLGGKPYFKMEEL